MKNPQFLRSIRLVCFVTMVSLLTGCTAVARAAYLELLPLQGFDTLQADKRVHYEPEAKTNAENLAANYAQTIQQIEARLGGTLQTTPQVYLCASDACYLKYAFNQEARAEARGRGNLVLLKARTLEAEGRLLPVFTHELVHAFWFQHGVHCTPRWWTEGLAVEVSNGGGAEKVTHQEALQAMQEGKIFHASDENSCWTRMPPQLNGMAWPMFYRQSGMFVQWMRVRDPEGFSALLIKLRSGDNLATAIESVYGQPLTALHSAWQKSAMNSTITPLENPHAS
ncbi:hypothetical protein [Polaromonas sp.]|uniref:hypothetical protein n=1 Tax=Polaromonas sp. TaxID=1869339 RepID=UPI00181AFA74|nr:hypothetical protein [Polaromonas sp.]NML85973.1 hypothetical protein [Polaromonas sp.]